MRWVLFGVLMFSLLLLGCTQPEPSASGATPSALASASPAPEASPTVSVDPSVYSDVDSAQEDFSDFEGESRDVGDTGDIVVSDFDRLG